MSDSESSGAWTSSESDVEKTPEEPSTRLRQRHGEKKAYKAPKGYVPSHLSEDILSCFGADRLGGKSTKELWCIKIPDGISPAQLDGLALDMPDDLGTSTRRSLAHIEIDRQGKKRDYSSFKQHYTLRLRSRAPVRLPSRKEAASTQLIAMAEDCASLQGGRPQEQDNEVDEMHNLVALLPDRSRQGQYVQASLPLKRHMQLVLDQPAQGSNSTTASSELGRQKMPRAQPRQKMIGYYNPTGSLCNIDKDAQGIDRQNKSPEREDKSDSSPRKKSKKDKAEKDSSVKKSKKVKA